MYGRYKILISSSRATTRGFKRFQIVLAYISMPIARNVEATCPTCGESDDTWVFQKMEGSGVKECYSCGSCAAEWTELHN